MRLHWFSSRWELLEGLSETLKVSISSLLYLLSLYYLFIYFLFLYHKLYSLFLSSHPKNKNPNPPIWVSATILRLTYISFGIRVKVLGLKVYAFEEWSNICNHDWRLQPFYAIVGEHSKAKQRGGLAMY